MMHYVQGIGELHLEIVCDKLLRQHGLEVLKGRAYVAYRESLRHGGAGGARRVVFDRVVGSRRLFAAIGFELLPVARVSDDPVFAIDKALKETVTNDEYIALHDGLRDALTRGLKGYPISGLRVAVSRMEKDPDTTPGAVRACAAALVQQLLATDEHCILEPFMNVEVELPSRSATITITIIIIMPHVSITARTWATWCRICPLSVARSSETSLLVPVMCQSSPPTVPSGDSH